MREIGDLLAILTVFVAVPVNWVVVVLLWRVARTPPRLEIERERAIVATGVAIIVTVFGLVFLNNDAEIPPLSTEITRIVTRATIFGSVVSALYWLYLYLRPR